ncbi:MAG TPA: acyl-CoA dehydrogenase family protein [Polyangiaceae bacterium]|nr:acyl-CoA dehydrogenase family protein [Polyangiaceae bacterium]
MISFSPTEDETHMIRSVAELASATLRPQIRAHEVARELSTAARRAAFDLGLGLLTVPESAGGPGLGLRTAVLLEEEVAAGDAGAAFALAGPGALTTCLTELGSPSQRDGLLAPFVAEGGHERFGAVAFGEARALPDRPGLGTVAARTSAGYLLTGTKSYVRNADRAELFVVFAQVDEAAGWDGLGAFAVRRDQDGVSVGARETTLGLDAMSVGTLSLDSVAVMEEARLTGGDSFSASLVRFLAKEALLVAARAVGLSREALSITREYVDTRHAFGKPIGHFQAVAFTVADRAMDVESARALVHRAAAAWDTNLPERECLLRTGYAVSFALEAAMRAGDSAVQLHGGAGFMRDYPVEKLMRDAKQLQLCVLTSAQADQLACATELGVAPALGLVLPTAESQSTLI